MSHYAHIFEPLYDLLNNGRKFEWGEEHVEAMKILKGMLPATQPLQKAVYDRRVGIYVTINTSPTGIEWVINQEEEGNTRFNVWFDVVEIQAQHWPDRLVPIGKAGTVRKLGA